MWLCVKSVSCRVCANSQTNNNSEFKRLALTCEIILFDWMASSALVMEWKAASWGHALPLYNVHSVQCTLMRVHIPIAQRWWELRAHYKTKGAQHFFSIHATHTKRLKTCPFKILCGKYACIVYRSVVSFFYSLLLHVIWYVFDFRFDRMKMLMRMIILLLW